MQSFYQYDAPLIFNSVNLEKLSQRSDFRMTISIFCFLQFDVVTKSKTIANRRAVLKTRVEVLCFKKKVNLKLAHSQIEQEVKSELKIDNGLRFPYRTEFNKID